MVAIDSAPIALFSLGAVEPSNWHRFGPHGCSLYSLAELAAFDLGLY
jgi:hypothetical protein